MNNFALLSENYMFMKRILFTLAVMTLVLTAVVVAVTLTWRVSPTVNRMVKKTSHIQ